MADEDAEAEAEATSDAVVLGGGVGVEFLGVRDI